MNKIIWAFLYSLIAFPAFAQDNAYPEEDPYRSLGHLGDVFVTVRDSYIKEFHNQELAELALKGMMMGLDPYSTYLNKEEYDHIKKSLEGDFIGIGVYIHQLNSEFIIKKVIKNSPAEKAELKKNDLIIKVDEKPVEGKSMDYILSLIKGEEGKEVTLTILRQDEEMDVKIIRAKVTKENVEAKILSDGIGYVKLAEFTKGASEQTKAQIEELEKLEDIKGMILDLRENPGGLLQEAISFADLFLDYGEILHVKGRSKDSLTRYYAFPGSIMTGKPILVLINSASASASEVLAGALQDLSRAIIVGEKTFGKGSVQNIIPFANGTAIKITTALYYTPSGDSIQAKGIIPDILIPEKPPKEKKVLSEAMMPSHLKNPDDEEGEKKQKLLKDAIDNSSTEDLEGEEDYQLARATSILKALILANTYSW